MLVPIVMSFGVTFAVVKNREPQNLCLAKVIAPAIAPDPVFDVSQFTSFSS